MLRDSTSVENDWMSAIGIGSEMGAMFREFDWASTSLGPPDTWSVGLRTAVGVCLSSRFPMLVVWGPELVKIYNDGYRPMLGQAKHPKAFGAPAHEIWPEIWHEIWPRFHHVLTTGRSTWDEHQLLMIERNGYLEECYFVYSYSPLFDDDGSIGGVLDVVTETTEQVVISRRLACLSELNRTLVDAEQVTEICLRATSALAVDRRDLRAVDIHLLVGDHVALIASNRREDIAGVDTELIAGVVRDRRRLVLGAPAGPPAPADHVVLPIGAPGGVEGAITFSVAPDRPLDEAYLDFLSVVASAIGNSLGAAFRRSVEVGEYRRISDTLQAAMLAPVSDLPTVAARYLPAVGNLAVGGDWYDVIELRDGTRALVVGDCVGHGLEAATVMAQLRSAARAMLLEGRDAGVTLDGLDHFAASVDGALCATVVCAVIDRHHRTVTYSRAGHLPPLVVGTDGARWLDGAGGLPLGLLGPDAHRPTETVRLDADDLVVMYTDGLVERRGEVIDVGLRRLADAVVRLRSSSVQQVADGLLHALTNGQEDDDVVLVVKHLTRAD